MNDYFLAGFLVCFVHQLDELTVKKFELVKVKDVPRATRSFDQICWPISAASPA